MQRNLRLPGGADFAVHILKSGHFEQVQEFLALFLGLLHRLQSAHMVPKGRQGGACRHILCRLQPLLECLLPDPFVCKVSLQQHPYVVACIPPAKCLRILFKVNGCFRRNVELSAAEFKPMLDRVEELARIS